MTRYVCIGCGYEISEDNVADETCPYCGGLIVKENEVSTQEIEAEWSVKSVVWTRQITLIVFVMIVSFQ